MANQAIDIAYYVLRFCSEQGKPISNLKLQKMLYFLWLDYFRRTGQSLFNEEFYAWQFGPVIPRVYNEFCAYAGIAIDVGTDDSLACVELANRDNIHSILQLYIDKTASQLVKKTHEDGTPWSQVYDGGRGLRSVIPFDLIKQFASNHAVS